MQNTKWNNASAAWGVASVQMAGAACPAAACHWAGRGRAEGASQEEGRPLAASLVGASLPAASTEAEAGAALADPCKKRQIFW